MTRVRRDSFTVMGTVASIVAAGDRNSFERITEIARRTLARAERRFTPFDPGSELGELRRSGAGHVPSADMRSVLDGCRLVETITDGAFRARDLRGRPDTTGFVKGWAMRRVELAARSQGLTDWLLNVGGDVVTSGDNRGRPWHVALRHPDDAGRVLEIIPLAGGAVATSGDYERGAHVWAPDGARGVRRGSCTVVGPRIDIADALATACWAVGAAAPAWLRRVPEYTVLFVSADGVVTSQGFPLVA